MSVMAFMKPDNGASKPATLAEKLTYLFAYSRAPDGRKIRVAAVAESCGASPTYIGYLRTGVRTNPTRRVLEGLARVFGVPLAYLLEEQPTSQPPTPIFDGTRGVAMRRLAGTQLSDAGYAAILAMIEQVQQLESAVRDRNSNTDPIDLPTS